MAAEVLLAFTHNLHDFPWLTSSWSVVSRFSDTVLLDDLRNLSDLLHNLCGSSNNCFSDVIEEILDDVREIVLWRVFRVHVDMAGDDLNDGHSD